MTAGSFAALILALGALFQIQLVPWTDGKSTCFPADADLDGRAEVFVLEAYRLRVYGQTDREARIDLVLPPGTGPLDIADIDRDGGADLVTVCGNTVLVYHLEGLETGRPAELFSLDNQFSHTGSLPFPSVLIVDRDRTPMIALPRAGVLEIRDLQGALQESYPIDVNEPGPWSFGRPFSYWVGQHAQLGPADALELRVSSLISYNPLQSGEGMTPEIGVPAARTGTPQQLRESISLQPDQWPWFTIGTQDSTEYRAMYAAAAGRESTAVVRVRSVTAGEEDIGQEAVQIGPARSFPGGLIVREPMLPDFDGDGFTDLLLWKPRQPSLTPDGLARAVSNSCWSLSLTTHLFLPEKARFAPKPAGVLEVCVPLSWWLSSQGQPPLRDVTLRDFDGDKKTDFACLTDVHTISVWTSENGAFTGAPAYRYRFPEPVTGIVLAVDLDGQGITTLGIASGNTLHLLRGRSPQADF